MIIVQVTESNYELKETGLFFSNLFSIVNSDEWANLKPETGDGGVHTWDKESRSKLSRSLKGRKCSDTTRKNMTKANRESAKVRAESIRKTLSDPDKKLNRITTMKEHLYTDVINDSRSKKMTEKRWYNDGHTQVRATSLPAPNWIEGRLQYEIPAITCPHCGKIGGISAMKRWHFEKCKSRVE